MKLRRKTQITIRTERLLIVGKRKASPSAVCPECGAIMVSPEEAAHALGKRTRDIYRAIENGTIHFTELVTGELFVCCGLGKSNL